MALRNFKVWLSRNDKVSGGEYKTYTLFMVTKKLVVDGEKAYLVAGFQQKKVRTMVIKKRTLIELHDDVNRHKPISGPVHRVDGKSFKLGEENKLTEYKPTEKFDMTKIHLVHRHSRNDYPIDMMEFAPAQKTRTTKHPQKK